jgi:hypothetical protein
MLKGIYHPRVVYPEKPKEPTPEPVPAADAGRKQRSIARRQRAVGR